MHTSEAYKWRDKQQPKSGIFLRSISTESGSSFSVLYVSMWTGGPSVPFRTRCVWHAIMIWITVSMPIKGINAQDQVL